MSGAWAGAWIVSDRFVDLIERLEPGINQFVPIPKTLNRKKEPIDKKFFILNILQQLPCIDVERSTVYWEDTSFLHEGKRLGGLKLQEKPGPFNQRRLFAVKATVSGYHLWRGTQKMFHTYSFISDQVYDEMARLGITGLNCERVEEY
jgi:hypothetical protein